MRLLIALGAGFAVTFGVGWLCHFSYQTDWVAALVLSCAIYLSFQIDELYILVLQSVPGAHEHAKLPAWAKKRVGSQGDRV
jgi:hypothetical protein